MTPQYNKALLGGIMAMSNVKFPTYHRRRDDLPQKEQLRRIALAQQKREKKALKKKETK